MSFDGIPRETVRFLAQLRVNNSKAWFDDHRKEYEQHYLAPAVAFVEALGPRLKRIDRDITFVAKVNGTIKRINRDTRFSKDKKPYKDHLDLWFWTGDNKGWDQSGFFFRLLPDQLMLGAGMHMFDAEGLKRYRAAVVDSRRGAALAKVVAGLAASGRAVGGETYKKVPAGLPADHARASLLKHSGLYTGWEGKHPKELSTPGFVDFVEAQFEGAAPLHRWLRTSM